MSNGALSGQLPPHKLIPNTGLIVDGFKYRSPLIKAYILSHAHSDHYTGLRDNWDFGPIYCSKVTGKLIVRILGVSPDLIHALEWDTPTHVEGVEVTLVDANHCPGAAQILFKLATGEAYVHCGDMRFGPHLLENPHLQRFQGCNAVFLDTTYCNPKYTFPPQEEAVEYIASTIHKLLNKQDGKRRLFLIQTYVIGKERILIEVNRRCNRKIFVSDKKLSFMECIQMPGLDTEKMFTTNPDETAIHVTQWGWLGESWPFFRPNFVNMETARKEMGVDEVIGFCPTGWMYEMKRSKIPVKTKGPNSIHLVPYSEHSSYNELREYVRFLKPHKVIPTVGVDGENADRNARAMLKHFRNLVDETASKASFLAAFKRGDSSTAADASPSRASSGGEPAPLEENDAANAQLDTCKDGAAGELDSREPGGNPGPLEELQRPGDEDNTPAEMPGTTIPQPSELQPKHSQDRDGMSDLSLQTVSMSVKHEQQQHAEDMELEPPAETPNAEASQKGSVKPEVNQTSGSQLELSLQPWAGGTGPQAAAASQQRAEAKHEQVQEAAEDPKGVVQREGGASTSSQSGSQTEQLCSILGGAISEQAADKLLLRCGGDLAKAVNAFYDSGTSGHGTALTGAKKLNPQKPQPSPKANAAKRKASSAKTPQRQPKLAKLSTDQRQITAFFGQGRSQVPAKGSTGNAAAPEPILLDDDPDDESVAISSSSPDEGRQSQPASQATQPPQVEMDDAGADAKPEAAAKPTLRLPPAPIFASATKGSSKILISTATPKEEDPAAATALERVPASRQAALGTKAARQVVPDRSAEVPADAVLKSVKEYQPVEMAIWAQGQPAPYLHIGRALAAMDSTTKRLRISDVIANMFRSLLALSPEDLLPAAYLVTGKLAPDYEGVEMNVGGSIVSGAVIEATGVTRQRLSAMYRELGDLGDVAQACRHNQATLQKPAPLTVRGVFRTMKQIAAEKGNGSATRKQRAVLGLLRSAREEEPKYIVRTLISNLRVGANWRSVMPGLARAFLLHEKGPAVSKAEMDAASTQVSEAFHLCPNLDVLVPALQAGGLAELERRCTLKAGVPLKPMLAKICEGIPDALGQLRGEFLAEFKYDGQRSQIHLLPNGSVKLFSRNCEDKTAAFPDVVEIVQQAAQGGAKELVMDTELVAVDRTDGNRLRAFQELSTRARGQTELHQVSVQVCVFVFDILMVDGEALIKRTLRERRARIALALPNMRPGHIQLAQSLQLPAPPPQPPKAAAGQKATEEENIAQDGEETEGGSLEASVQTYLLESFASGTEGLMLKALDTNATYQASKRSESWLKIKKDYCEGLRDSLDLVPIGAWYGQGRKTGWFSPFLLAAWDPDREEFQSVCRCMSGFTDAFYMEATERLSQRQCERKSYYNTGESPSVWFKPGEVWEIRGADLTISPVHRAAIGCIDANPERGVSLRFPRYIRTREDKTIEEASSPEVITDLYNKQSRKMSSAKAQLEAQKRQDKAAQQADSGSDTAEAEGDNQEADPLAGMDAE